MKTLISISVIVLLACCQTKNSDKQVTTQKADPCDNLKDSLKINIVFSKADTVLPTKDFFEIIKFIESKGNMRLQIDDDIPLKVDYWKDIYLTHVVDTCNHKYLTQFFVLKNVTASSCYFKSKTPFKGTKDYYPRFNFIQWNFANNSDRDSAYKIMHWVYNNDAIITYEYRYNQTVFADKRLYMFEPGVKMFEEIGIEYAKYLKQHLSGQENNSR